MVSCVVRVLVPAFLSVLYFHTTAALSTEQAPRNFLVILADDVGFGDIGVTCRAKAGNVSNCPSTPVLDALATDSATVYFNRYYSGAGVCSPTRSSVLSGRTNQRSCIQSALPCDHMNPAWSCSMGSGMARSEFSIADAVKAKNSSYVTQHLGKWYENSNLLISLCL